MSKARHWQTGSGSEQRGHFDGSSVSRVEVLRVLLLTCLLAPAGRKLKHTQAHSTRQVVLLTFKRKVSSGR